MRGTNQSGIKLHEECFILASLFVSLLSLFLLVFWLYFDFRLLFFHILNTLNILSISFLFLWLIFFLQDRLFCIELFDLLRPILNILLKTSCLPNLRLQPRRLPLLHFLLSLPPVLLLLLLLLTDLILRISLLPLLFFPLLSLF